MQPSYEHHTIVSRFAPSVVIKQPYSEKNCWDLLIWVTGHCNRAAVSRNRYGVERKNCWYSYNIDKCNKILCLSSRNMIDKTMCEVLWRNISDFYVNLRVEVGKFYVRFLKIFYSETTGKFTLAIYFNLGQE